MVEMKHANFLAGPEARMLRPLRRHGNQKTGQQTGQQIPTPLPTARSALFRLTELVMAALATAAQPLHALADCSQIACLGYGVEFG